MQQIFAQELRFKADDGSDYPDWEEKKFSEYIKLYRGSSPRPIIKFTTKESNGVNWIKIGDTKNSKNYLIESVEEKITIEGSKKSRKVFIGELILANSMSFGKTYLLNIEGCIYDGWFVLREFEKFYNKDFIHQLLNSDFLQKQYKTLSAGGVVQNISSEVVYSTILLKPTLPEQTKIANFLSAIDQKINHCGSQLEKTQDWKKGLLQQLFV
ncbi:restriction endonuclease subunit S [uncultured Cytophaga sp.]|uniref:restriction endonuclease subunit S n=1 Tax=uncultured Cytophaga sp. TaxID=160238 RepID=UPI002626DB0F|nr:restriction endonuclease subunit S [uncultured Cytophaga sp.]